MSSPLPSLSRSNRWERRRSMRTRLVVLALALEWLFALIPAARAGPKFKVLHSFGAPKDGAYPDGSPSLDGKGDLYGVTAGGPGQYGNGTVYELSPHAGGGWRQVILHSFSAGSDGGDPWGGLVLDKNGNVYGTLLGEPPYADWGVFELSHTPGGWTNTVIYTDAAGPGLLIDGSGNLYGGMAPGQYGYAAIGELSPGSNGWTYTAIYSFCKQQNCVDPGGVQQAQFF